MFYFYHCDSKKEEEMDKGWYRVIFSCCFCSLLKQRNVCMHGKSCIYERLCIATKLWAARETKGGLHEECLLWYSWNPNRDSFSSQVDHHQWKSSEGFKSSWSFVRSSVHACNLLQAVPSRFLVSRQNSKGHQSNVSLHVFPSALQSSWFARKALKPWF